MDKLLKNVNPALAKTILQREKQIKQNLQAASIRKAEELKSNSDLQRRKRLGADGRAREAVEIHAKNLLERRRLLGEVLPSWEECLTNSASRMQRLKTGGKF